MTDALGPAFQYFLATLFLVEGARKLAGPAKFRDAMASYGVIPPGLLRPTAVALPIAEIVSGIALSVSLRTPVPLLIMLSYGAAIYLSMAKGTTVDDCGCSFGAQNSPLSRWHAIRAGALAMLAGIVTWSMPFAQPDWWQVLPAVASLWLTYLACDQLISTRSRYPLGGL